MRKTKFVALSIIAVILAIACLAVSAAPAAAQETGHGKYGLGVKSDNPMHPLGEKQRALRKTAMEMVARGQVSAANGKSFEVAKGQYVELAREGEDLIWTVLGEFLDFSHNIIAEPDRSVDNSTIWNADFSRDYYLDLLFADGGGVNSVRNFYIEQSSNRYAVNGDVTDWSSLPGTACSYDDDAGALALWQILIDSTEVWYNTQIASGITPAEIDAYLSQFDVWDRYDYDGDGNFDEPDGYIDHFQSVHAGEGEEAGGGALGSCAIWSHRWYAYYHTAGVDGPPFNLSGGVQIGTSDYWIGDYTIEPENGGVGVFAHEFGHDLGLPDLYDTSGATNGTGFWTLMSSGSWLSAGTEDIGSKPGHMGVWEKFQLGWLNYEVAFAGSKSEHKLGPAETNTKQAQGLFVVLPDKAVLTSIGDPFEGEYFYYSGAGNELDNLMYRSFTLAAASTLSAAVSFDIETDWDYAYLVASTDGGLTWVSLDTNQSTSADPNGQNFGFGITGNSSGWTILNADLSAFSGDVMIGFRYWTDGFVTEPGFMVDDIAITGYPIDGAESDAGWTYMPVGGFRVTTGEEIDYFFNAYVAAFRQYRDYDDALRTGPYNFGFLDNPALGNWVERFSYQDGLLISYWDGSQANNNVGTHPGEGLILPIDAHPYTMHRNGGGIWVGRIPTFDATFGFEPTDAITLHRNSIPTQYPSLPAVPVFDDMTQYYNPEVPWAGVINPNTGTQIRIKSVSARGSFMQVQVRPSKPHPQPGGTSTFGTRR